MTLATPESWEWPPRATADVVQRCRVPLLHGDHPWAYVERILPVGEPIWKNTGVLAGTIPRMIPLYADIWCPSCGVIMEWWLVERDFYGGAPRPIRHRDKREGAMKKIDLQLTVDGAQVMHGAVKKRLEVVQHNATQAGQVERDLLQEADRELSEKLPKALSRPEQDG